MTLKKQTTLTLVLIVFISCKRIEQENSCINYPAETIAINLIEKECSDCKCKTGESQYRYILYEVEKLKLKLNFNEHCKPIGYYFKPIPLEKNKDRYVLKVKIEYENGNWIEKQLDHKAISIETKQINNYIFEESDVQGFCGDHIQFFLDKKNHRNFSNSYIGYNSLKHIFENATLIAISGSQINAGRFFVKNESLRISRDDSLYSSLKFMGFNSSELPAKYEVQAHRTKENVFAASIAMLQVGKDKIPAETILAPCPPRWVPRKRQ